MVSWRWSAIRPTLSMGRRWSKTMIARRRVRLAVATLGICGFQQLPPQAVVIADKLPASLLLILHCQGIRQRRLGIQFSLIDIVQHATVKTPLRQAIHGTDQHQAAQQESQE